MAHPLALVTCNNDLELQDLPCATVACYPKSQQEWNVYRPLIIYLYQQERMTLKEVMEIMEFQHGLKATQDDQLPLALGTQSLTLS
jgi:Clr5 domain